MTHQELVRAQLEGEDVSEVPTWALTLLNAFAESLDRITCQVDCTQLSILEILDQAQIDGGEKCQELMDANLLAHHPEE